MRFAMQVHDSGAIRYGLIASRTAVALGEILVGEPLNDQSRAALESARRFLEDLLVTQKYYSEHLAVPRQDQIDAFNSALRVIVDHQRDLQVTSIQELVDLFFLVDSTLEVALSSGKMSDPDAIAKAQGFFRVVGDSMNRELASPAPLLMQSK